VGSQQRCSHPSDGHRALMCALKTLYFHRDTGPLERAAEYHHLTCRERRSSPTLQTFQEPILLLPWDGAFQLLATPLDALEVDVCCDQELRYETFNVSNHFHSTGSATGSTSSGGGGKGLGFICVTTMKGVGSVTPCMAQRTTCSAGHVCAGVEARECWEGRGGCPGNSRSPRPPEMPSSSSVMGSMAVVLRTWMSASK
jgi:hypothetical protein